MTKTLQSRGPPQVRFAAKQPGTHHLELRRLSDEHAMGVDVARAFGVGRNVDSRIIVGPRLCAPHGRYAGPDASRLRPDDGATRNVCAACWFCSVDESASRDAAGTLPSSDARRGDA